MSRMTFLLAICCEYTYSVLSHVQDTVDTLIHILRD